VGAHRAARVRTEGRVQCEPRGRQVGRIMLEMWR
jgi:hypothetical protein